MHNAQNITIIGSTGSIGTQTLQVIAAAPKEYTVFGLGCHKNVDLLFDQIQKFQPKIVAIYKKSAGARLVKMLKNLSRPNFKLPQVLSGPKSWEQLAAHAKTQKIVFASNGTTAYQALTQAIKSHKLVALANKEVIVAHGARIMRLAKLNKVTIVPIDSEHSAIFQCLQGEDPRNIEKVILTCSGGPFFGKNSSDLQKVTPAQALNHPTWKMGKKISIDSATLMNKGFELIEAMHLFGLREDQIEILIHPESIIHSMVQFKDGSVKAQMGTPDMRLPISYALAYPRRSTANWPRIDFTKLNKLTFLQPDYATFQGPVLARQAFRKGGKLCRDLTKANDLAVEDFLNNKITFDQIFPQIKNALKNS